VDHLLYPLIALMFGYACGAVPFGLVLTRIAGTPDLRSIGSGNIGATNVLRTGRKGLAATTLALDMFKATFAIVLAARMPNADLTVLAAAAGAFLGHVFPVWLKFKGGKGWPPIWAVCLVWLGRWRLFLHVLGCWPPIFGAIPRFRR